MASNHVCIICTKTEVEESDLKLFSLERWETAKKAATRRITLQNDYFFGTSQEVRKIEQPESRYYHTSCFSHFCAVKKHSPADNELSQLPSKVTRSTSDHPSTNHRGVLGQECLFVESRGRGSHRKMNP